MFNYLHILDPPQGFPEILMIWPYIFFILKVQFKFSKKFTDFLGYA